MWVDDFAKQVFVESLPSNFAKLKTSFNLESWQKKLQACETSGKLIIAACWIPVKACQLLMEDLAHKDPSRRHRAKDKLPKSHCSSTNSLPQHLYLYLHCILFCICISTCQLRMEDLAHKEHPEHKLTNSHCFSTNTFLSTFWEMLKKGFVKKKYIFLQILSSEKKHNSCWNTKLPSSSSMWLLSFPNELHLWVMNFLVCRNLLKRREQV